MHMDTIGIIKDEQPHFVFILNDWLLLIINKNLYESEVWSFACMVWIKNNNMGCNILGTSIVLQPLSCRWAEFTVRNVETHTDSFQSQRI